MKKILLVDDSNVIRDSLRDIIKKNHEVEILEAANGMEGLAVIEQNRDISLMFVDVNMPELDGIGMLKRIKSDYGDLDCNIIMLTTEAAKDIKEDAKANGAKAWILKPVKEEKINIIFEKLL